MYYDNNISNIIPYSSIVCVNVIRSDSSYEYKIELQFPTNYSITLFRLYDKYDLSKLHLLLDILSGYMNDDVHGTTIFEDD